ncbi:MAG TPA: amino acid adenylation domain-containing protein [Telluria sp.]|nr:amino acid adenylation domain-containing protein [Telluria sp.]
MPDTIDARKAAIAAFMKKHQPAPPVAGIVPRAADEAAVLSFGQERLWVLDRMGAGAAYNISATLRLRGKLDADLLCSCVSTLVERHAILRARLARREEAVLQVAGSEAFGVARRDASGLARDQRTALLAELESEAIGRPYDLETGPLFSAQLIRLDAEEHVLLLAMHHIVWDGWSGRVFARELCALYAAKSRDPATDPLPPARLQFADYAAWQRGAAAQTVLDKQLAYWLGHLDGAPALLTLPTDRPRPALQSYAGAVLEFDIESTLIEELAGLARGRRATLFSALLAVYYVLLSRYSGQADICIGTPASARTRPEVQDLVGFFVNTLALRIRATPMLPFADLLRETADVVLHGQANQEVPFERVVEAVKPERSTSYSPLFQAMFVLQESLDGVIELPGLELSLGTRDSSAAKFDLSLTVIQEAGRWKASLHYNTDLFDAATMARLGRHYVNLLRSAARFPGTPAAALDMLDETERHRLLVEWNATAAAYPRGLTLPRMLDAQAALTPDRPAVSADGVRWTYAELHARANRLAHYLRAQGVGPDVVVGVAAERSAEMVLALVAIVKAGGAYLPLDPGYPKDRLAYMIGDARPRLLLTQERLLAAWDTHTVPVFCLDRDWNRLADYPETAPPDAACGSNLAYVIYTSGSTGRPKGVAVDHAGIVNRLQWMQEAYGLGSADRVLQKTPFSFDVSVWEFFWTLAYGATLVMARPGGHQDPHYLAALIEQEEVTTLHFVPPMLEVFLDTADLRRCAGLRQVMCSGQALPLELQQRFLRQLPSVRLHNLYGPTEASVDVTSWECRDDVALRCVPIGRPIANIQIHILDAQLNPVPAGVAGQLFIAGVGLARGYLHRPELSAEKFVPNPYATQPGSRMYQSGDLARYLPDGSIEYLGRIDDQVKIRGFRIELGEIEAALAAQEGVREAVVVARRDLPGEAQLVAYVVGAGLDTQAGGRLRAALAQTLPEHMVPTHCVVLDALPLSANGKVDKRALPAPDLKLAQAKYVAPVSATETALAEIWAGLLNAPNVGVNDSFFDIGGNSLLAIQMHSRICERFGQRLTVIDLFQLTTVAKLAAFLDRVEPAACQEEEGMARGAQRRARAQQAVARSALRAGSR